MTSANDDEPTDVLPRFHECCNQPITMAEVVFGEHVCRKTLASMARAVREMLEGRDNER